MANPGEKLAASLEILKRIQSDKKVSALLSSEISRTHRERLFKNGFLKEVAKGWYLITDPTESAGDSTSWYTSFWHFCSRYLNNKFGNDYCLSPEQSLFFHVGDFTVPEQLLVRAPMAPNKVIDLIHGTSIFEIKSELPNTADILKIEGLNVLSFPIALMKCTQIMYENNSNIMRTALSQIKDSSEILRPLLEGSNSVIAGRLAGAFRNIGRSRIADEIIKTMKSADFKVSESDPFKDNTNVDLSPTTLSPYVQRIKLMWDKFRDDVIKEFPKAPHIPKDQVTYLRTIDEIYVTDAYHSLSIEQYKVSVELIEKVRKGDWDILNNEEDQNQKDAMAARGYWQASQVVQDSIKKILNGQNPGTVALEDHGDWYRQLFAPSVTAGIIKATDLAGYRKSQVYISDSRHIPLKSEAVLDVMPLFFELLEQEKDPGVRAVLGHFTFVYIHPYMDGNGRMARFLMNTMLASGGYPWTVIPLNDRNIYMKALERASVGGDIKQFASFISHLVREGMKGTPVARISPPK